MKWILACLHHFTDIFTFSLRYEFQSCNIMLPSSACFSVCWARLHPVRAVCQKLSSLDQCSRLPAELTKARINICAECSGGDGHDRDKGDKTTRDVETRRQQPMIQAVVPIYWPHCFKLTDARETRWKVHCVCMTFSAFTFMWAAERKEEELAFWPSAPGSVNKI